MSDNKSVTTTPRSLSKFIRRTHLLVALFLTPWITMYALSTLVMHHRVLFTGHERRVAPAYDLIRDDSYELQVGVDESSDDVARRVLAELGISGAFSARGDPSNGLLTIDRHRAIGSYRVTFDSQADKLKVERQKWGLAFFLEMLHRRHGLREDYLTNDLWAILVDIVVFAIVLWGVTGVWMWLQMSRTRKLGSLCLVGGSLLFASLLFLL